MMTSVTHCPPAGRLEAFEQGRLSEADSSDVIDHLNACAVCQSHLDTNSDREDSLITSLRAPDSTAPYSVEPDYHRAMAKALAALAQSSLPESTGESRPELPEQIGEYAIVRPLGRGGMGSVYLARHQKLSRQVALKVLVPHRLGDQRVRDRFESEMRAIGQLSHPNIVTAYDAREIDGVAVLVTEFIDGLDLGELVSRVGTVSIADACEICKQVAMALQYTSDQGFVHRDIKPSNIMLTQDGHVKLLDLGLARFTRDTDQPEMTATGQALGTADYVAPEQVTDGRSVDVRADIYGLGCTLFKLLSGMAPFATESHVTAFAKMTAHVSTPAPHLIDVRPDVPRKLSQSIDSMLAKSPADRPQTPRDVAQALSAFAIGHDLRELVHRAVTTASPPTIQTASLPATLAHRSHPWHRRPTAQGWLIAAGLAGVVLGFVCGVIVTIKYPDGTEIVHRAPEGAQVEITSDSQSHENTETFPNSAPRESNAAAAPTETPDVHRGADGFQYLGPSAIKQLHSSPEPAEPLSFHIISSRPMLIPYTSIPNFSPFVWYPLADEMADSLPSAEVFVVHGIRGALTLGNPSRVVGWKELKPHLVINSRGTTTEMVFRDGLADRLADFSEVGHMQRMAIVANGCIVSAPRIVSTLRDHASLTGTPLSKASRSLMESFNGGLVETPREKAEPRDLLVTPYLQGKWMAKPRLHLGNPDMSIEPTASFTFDMETRTVAFDDALGVLAVKGSVSSILSWDFECAGSSLSSLPTAHARLPIWEIDFVDKSTSGGGTRTAIIRWHKATRGWVLSMNKNFGGDRPATLDASLESPGTLDYLLVSEPTGQPSEETNRSKDELPELIR